MSTHDEDVLAAQASSDLVPDPMSAPPVRWGILGAGSIGGSFAEAVNRYTQGSVTAVGSRDLAKAQAFSDAHGAGRAHAGYEDLVEDPDVDVVYVATPHSLHRDHALLAIAAGKPVLVEKAFTRNHAEACEVLDAARSAGLFVMEAMWTLFLPHVAAIRAAVAAGLVGDVRTVLGDFGRPFPADPDGRLWNPDLAGGALLDLGVYPVSFAHDLLGAPVRVGAIGTPTDQGVDGNTVIGLDFDGGRYAAISTNLWAYTPTRVTVGGTEGMIVTDPHAYMPTGFTVVQADGTERRHEGWHGEGKQFEAAEVARCLADGLLESPRLPWQHTLDVMRTLDEVRRQVGVRFPGE